MNDDYDRIAAWEDAGEPDPYEGEIQVGNRYEEIQQRFRETDQLSWEDQAWLIEEVKKLESFRPAPPSNPWQVVGVVDGDNIILIGRDGKPKLIKDAFKSRSSE